ncbi:MAG: hypothetical protein Q8R47_02685 [Nanoarchaeota archaeon]|nr:hypothetical protein [Nanoarchaeota archaeon]
MVSPLSLGQEELPQPDKFSTTDKEFQDENAFNNNPTPENFNNLPDPTAADLAKVPNPTVENFNRLPPNEQGIYLVNENLYRQEFADQYYSNPTNWGVNNLADQIFFKQETGLRDFLKKGSTEKNAAQQYFTKTFGAPYNFNNLAEDFFFDHGKGILKNGLTNLVLADFKNDLSITSITSTDDGFEISRKIEDKEQKVSVAGTEAKTISYDQEKGSFTFQLPNGGKQKFEVPDDAQVAFTFDAGKLTVDGPASGIVNTKNDYAQFINHDGRLILNYDGDVDAENAELITSRLFMDGRYSKRGNKIEAWDVGKGGKQTVVVDKNACPEAGACVGASTQGQWDARYLSDKSKASTLKINLDEISSTSSFYADPHKPQPVEEEKAKQLREQAQQLRKPNQPPLQGKNAEVWINKDEGSKSITVTSKGVVEVGFYDARGNSAKKLNDKFNYKGLNGLSELDAQFSARTQTNVRGQAEFKNDQFKDGIFTNQDGAVIKINHDNFRPDQADAIRAECFNCKAGEAMVIRKTIAVAAETGIQGVFTGAARDSVRLTVNVDEKGKIIFAPDKKDLGLLASQIPKGGQQVSIGNNLFVSVPCLDGLLCQFRLSRDPRTNEVGATQEFINPKDPETPVKRIEYPLTIGKVLGSEAVLVSERNAAEVDKLALLIEEGKFNELSKLSFDTADAGYAALKKKFLLESGLNLDAVSDQKYARELQTVIETTKQAREIYKKYGIELDALGGFKTREDAEKYQQIVNKGLGADVDELSRAKWDLARMRVKEVEGLLLACQGTSYCLVSEKDLKTAKEEEKKIVGARTANYNRWKVLVTKAELDRQLKEAEERSKKEDKGIDATDKKELEDAKRKIDHGEKRKVDLGHTLNSQKGRVNNYRNELRAKLENEWLKGGGKGAVFLAIDWERYGRDPDYVVSLINKHAPRGFLNNKLDPEIYTLRENFRVDAQAAAETQTKVNQLDTNLKALESQNQALIDKYRLEGKDDVAAEAALLAGKYQEVNNILSGPNIATQEGIKEVVKLGKDKDGNVVVVEKIDVSVLAGQHVVSPKVAQDLADRAVRQQRDETLDQVALLYDYGYGNEAGAILQEIEAGNPELAQKLEEAKTVPDSILDPDLVKLKKVRIAQTDYAKRFLEQREQELEEANHQARLKKEEEDLGAGKEVARAWKNIDTSGNPLDVVADTVALGGHSFSFLFDSSEKAAADALGITKIRDDLDQQAFQEQERQMVQLHSLRFKLKEYEARGLSPAQAFADARAGLDRGADNAVISSSAENQIAVFDEPAAALLEFDLTKSVFSEEDQKFLETSNDFLAKNALIQQRKEAYELARRELEFNSIVRDAENTQRFNRDKLAGEAAAKYKEALAVCPDCAGAKNVQRTLDTLNQNVLGEIIGVYTGEEAGRAVAGGLERVGVTYTRETEEEFRDMAISSFDALVVFDVAEVVIGAPLAAIDTLQKLRKISKTVDAAGTAIDAYRYASKGSREVFAAAKAAERTANTVEAAAQARKTVEVAKEALEAEIKAGQQASKYQKFQRAINTPLGKFDRDVAKARNVEIDTIAAQTQNINQAQRELAAARQSEDALAEGQSLVKISDAREAIGKSAKNIDELDEVLRVSKIAGPKNGAVQNAWGATFGKVFGGGPGEEVLTAEQKFRRAADNFAEAGANARLVGDTPEAVLSRARLDATKESLEVAAERVEDAYLNRKFEKSKFAIQQRLQQAQVSGKGDEVFDAAGAEGVATLDEIVGNPAVQVKPEGTGLRFEVPEDAPPQLRIQVDEGNRLLLRIDTSEVRAEAELEEKLFGTLADSEYAAAHDAKARRLEAVGEGKPKSLVSDAVNPCNLAAAAIYGLAPCATSKVVEALPAQEAPSPSLEEIAEEPLSVVENRIDPQAENAPTAFQRQIQEGKDLERLLEEQPLSNELYTKATLDSHGALKLPVFENNLPPRYTLYEISMDRDTVKGLNDVSYEIGTNAISTQHQQLIQFAKQNGLPVTTLQKTTYIAVPEGSVTGIDEVLKAVENAKSATSQATKQPIKLRVGVADSADSLMETRLRTKRSLEFTEQNKVPPTKYGGEVKGWYDQLPVEQKANVNDIFAGYDETLKNQFAELNKLKAEGKTEEYQQKLAQLATTDIQDAKFSNLPMVKKYQSDPITGIREGDAVVSTDGIALGKQNKEDVLVLTEENLPDAQLAAQLGRKIDNSINQVNGVIKETYFQAVDNVNLQQVEVIGKYDEIARAAKYPDGSITNTDELKDFLKWEFENRGRFRGGDETFMTLRKEVLDVNPEFARTLQQAVHLCETCDYGVRVGFKEVGAGENYAQAISAADQAVITSKKLGDVPVVVDRFGNVKPLGAGLQTDVPTRAGVSDIVEPCAVAGGAIHGLSVCLTGVASAPTLSPATDKGNGVFELGGTKYVYTTEKGWTTKGFLGFGKKQVTSLDELVGLEAARLNIPISEAERNIVETPFFWEKIGVSPSQSGVGQLQKLGSTVEVKTFINDIKQSYATKNIDLEAIIKNHPTVNVKKTDVSFTGKIGEGTVGVVFEGNLEGVGENLAFKTAKAKGVERALRGTLQGNVDSLFKEMETAQQVCHLVPCPKYYGIYEVDGIPYLVSDKVEGRHFFDLTDEEIVQYFTEKKLEEFGDDLLRATEQGWKPRDIQAMVLTKPQVVGGIPHQKGDIIFMDVAEWKQDAAVIQAIKQNPDLSIKIAEVIAEVYAEQAMIRPLVGAENALKIKRDSPFIAKTIEEANLHDLQKAFEKAGYKEPASPQYIGYFSDPQKRLRRMFETDVDPTKIASLVSAPQAVAVQ